MRPHPPLPWQRWGVVDEPTGSKSWVFSDEEIGGVKCDDPLNHCKVHGEARIVVVA